MADSSTGGYLQPQAAQPPEDDALANQLQSAIVGITGLDGTLVRPRWQLVPPKQPEPGTNWASVGVEWADPDDSPSIQHYPNMNGGLGADVYVMHESLNILASFYGPNGQGFASIFRDGLRMPQNMEQLRLQNLSIIDTSEIRATSELINQQWVRRYDIPIRMRRKVQRQYSILNLLSGQYTIKGADSGIIVSNS